MEKTIILIFITGLGAFIYHIGKNNSICRFGGLLIYIGLIGLTIRLFI